MSLIPAFSNEGLEWGALNNLVKTGFWELKCRIHTWLNKNQDEHSHIKKKERETASQALSWVHYLTDDIHTQGNIQCWEFLAMEVWKMPTEGKT